MSTPANQKRDGPPTVNWGLESSARGYARSARPRARDLGQYTNRVLTRAGQSRKVPRAIRFLTGSRKSTASPDFRASRHLDNRNAHKSHPLELDRSMTCPDLLISLFATEFAPGCAQRTKAHHGQYVQKPGCGRCLRHDQVLGPLVSAPSAPERSCSAGCTGSHRRIGPRATARGRRRPLPGRPVGSCRSTRGWSRPPGHGWRSG